MSDNIPIDQHNVRIDINRNVNAVNKFGFEHMKKMVFVVGLIGLIDSIE